MTAAHPQALVSPRGMRVILHVRDETSDLALGFSTFSDPWTVGADEYDLAHLTVDGVFVDVGAHIGIVSLAVLVDNPNSRAILVEPVPENMALARLTMRDNGLSARVTYVEAAVGTATVRYGSDDVADRYVGNIGIHTGHTIDVAEVTLEQLVAMADGRIAALKTDCEGGEWRFLRSPAVASVDYIFGEWHGDTKHREGRKRLERLIGKTHEIVRFTDGGGIGLFWAVRR